MPSDPQGEGLAGPGPPDHHSHAGAALAHIPHHRLLIGSGRPMRG
jgi:hypothetical protein